MAVIKILACGGRDFNDYNKVYDALDKYRREYEVVFIIHGGAAGADSIAETWAVDHGFPSAKVEANWDFYGKSAGPVRNGWMLLLDPDLVVAFPGGNGTENMKALAEVSGVTVIEVE